MIPAVAEPPGVWEPLPPTENYYLTESELRFYDLRNRSLNATDHVDKIYPVYNTEAEAAAAAIYERDRRLKAAGAGLLERILTAIFHPGGFFDYGVLAGYGFSGGAVGRGWQTDPIPLAYEVNPGIYLEMPQPGPGQELYGPWPEAVGPRANPVAPRSGLVQGSNPSRVVFDGMEVRGVRNLSHIDDTTLRAMAKSGFAPKDINGNKLILHHLNQNPPGPVVEMPRLPHSIGNRVQHPLGNAPGAGLTTEQRAAFNAWRESYWKARALDELARRGLMP
jgi:hypothetical protein